MPRRGVPRRRALLSVISLVVGAAAARAETRDLALTCDTTLAPSLRKAGAAYTARTGARVFVFPTGPGLILPQLERAIQNDIVVTQVSILDQVRQAGLLVASPSGPRWRNPFVIAGPAGASDIAAAFAVPDPTPAFAIDGPALLAKLGIKPARLLGAVDTTEVANLLTSGAAQAGLLHLTDVRANLRLEVVRPVPPDIQPPRLYAASVTKLARRPDPESFVQFLASSEAAGLLVDNGLEIQA